MAQQTVQRVIQNEGQYSETATALTAANMFYAYITWRGAHAAFVAILPADNAFARSAAARAAAAAHAYAFDAAFAAAFARRFAQGFRFRRQLMLLR